MLLWTLLTLRNARTSSPPTARKHPSRSTAPPLWLVMTPRLLAVDMAAMVDMVLESVKLTLSLRLMPRLMLRLMLSQARATPLDLSAMTRRTGSARRSPSRTLARFLARSARPSLTPPTLRTARTSSPPTARRRTRRCPTPLLWLVTTPRLFPVGTAAMEAMATEVLTYESVLLKPNWQNCKV